MIDHITGASAGGFAGERARIRTLEGSKLRRITLDASIAVTLARGALRVLGLVRAPTLRLRSAPP
jgi:hypothetical protein